MKNGKTWPRPSYRICWRRRVAIGKGFRKKTGGLGSGEDGISPIPYGSGMENGKTWPRPSYRICWRTRVAIRKGFRKKWAIWNQEKTASLLYPSGRDGESEDTAETILSYLLAELESSNPQRILKKM